MYRFNIGGGRRYTTGQNTQGGSSRRVFYLEGVQRHTGGGRIGI